LGVFIAKTLLERSGATVSFANLEQGGGAEVRVVWRRSAFEAANAEPAPFFRLPATAIRA
jgi:hypothetical protein